MNHEITIHLSPDVSGQAMTHSLGGCTAVLILCTGTYGSKLVFAHYASLDVVLNLFKTHCNSYDEFIVVVKAPGNYVNEDGTWVMDLVDKKRIMTAIDKPNVKLVTIPYNLFRLARSDSDSYEYESSLYVKYNGSDVLVSNDNGRFHSIVAPAPAPAPVPAPVPALAPMSTYELLLKRIRELEMIGKLSRMRR